MADQIIKPKIMNNNMAFIYTQLVSLRDMAIF